jgi:hypothetical protein
MLTRCAYVVAFALILVASDAFLFSHPSHTPARALLDSPKWNYAAAIPRPNTLQMISAGAPIPRRGLLAAIQPRMASNSIFPASLLCVFPALFQGSQANAEDRMGSMPIGHKSEFVLVGGKRVPLEVWYSLGNDKPGSRVASELAEYPYSISITKLFRVLAKREVLGPPPSSQLGHAPDVSSLTCMFSCWNKYH